MLGDEEYEETNDQLYWCYRWRKQRVERVEAGCWLNEIYGHDDAASEVSNLTSVSSDSESDVWKTTEHIMDRDDGIDMSTEVDEGEGGRGQ